jgi:hypothetical protein
MVCLFGTISVRLIDLPLTQRRQHLTIRQANRRRKEAERRSRWVQEQPLSSGIHRL